MRGPRANRALSLLLRPVARARARTHARPITHVVRRSARRLAGGRGAASPPAPPEAREVHGRRRGDGDGHRGAGEGGDRQQQRGLPGDMPGAQRHVADQRRVGLHRPRRRGRSHARVRRRRTHHLRHGGPLYLPFPFPSLRALCWAFAETPSVHVFTLLLYGEAILFVTCSDPGCGVAH